MAQTVAAVAELLELIRDDEDYCGYLILYAQQQEIRQLLRETFFSEIYIDAVAGPANSIIFKLPGILYMCIQTILHTPYMHHAYKHTCLSVNVHVCLHHKRTIRVCVCVCVCVCILGDGGS